ncbi:MAG: BadF/BadG/BcrA/BcrD ATPase family protein [Patescibacteria group bacterium]
MKFFIGIDGGASKTELLVLDENRQPVLQRVFGSSNMLLAEAVQTRQELYQAIDTLQGLYPDGEFMSCFGLSGLDTEADAIRAREFYQAGLTKVCGNHCQIVNDGWIAMRAGTKSANALVLISGTGSNCLGKNDRGQTAKAGGMDYLLSDEGSGYEIGLMTLRAALRSYDGRDEKSKLEEKVRVAFKVNSIGNLKNLIYEPLISKKDIAGLAKICFEAESEGDVKARQIINQAVEELFLMVKAVADRLELQQRQADLVMVGGVLDQMSARALLMSRVRQFFPEMSTVFPTRTSAYGACLLAIESFK